MHFAGFQSIAENNITTEGIEAVCAAVQENRALKYLNISGKEFCCFVSYFLGFIYILFLTNDYFSEVIYLSCKVFIYN